jgi:proteasome lid subunit RPN8/RPN11
LFDHAYSEAPQEACGILGIDPDSGQVIRWIATANRAADPTRFYAIDPTALAQYLPELSDQGLQIGFYHSHPNGDPIPSVTDVSEATYPESPYLILGIKQDTRRLAAWELRYGAVTPIPLHISDLPPAPYIDESLSSRQTVAILLTGAIVFSALIAIALSLLPPAPPIPT